jgi:fibronectin-binding autotransporter adhesin
MNLKQSSRTKVRIFKQGANMNSKNITALFLIAALATSTAQADTYKWDGGGSDDNWSTAENWNPDGTVPISSSNTTVTLDGTTRMTPNLNISDPIILNRFEFENTGTSAFSLSGNQLQFEANTTAQPSIYLKRDASCVINIAINVPAGTILNLQIGTYGVTLSGLITGEGALDKSSASGGISLKHADNTFSGGLTIRANNSNWAKFNVYASGAMGTGPVKLYGGSMTTGLTSPGGLVFYNTNTGNATTHTNSIDLFQDSPIFAGMPNGEATVTLDGEIDLNTYTLHLRGGGNGTINGMISEGDASAIIKNDAGIWTLAGNNTFTGSLTINNGTIRLGTGNALDPQVGVSLTCATGWSFGTSATLGLNGFNQTISQLNGSIAETGLNNILTSTGAAVLTVDQSTDTVFHGALTGALGLIKEGTGTLTLSNVLSTTTGDITVSNGTLVVAAGADLGKGATIEVAGGSLELRTLAAIANSASLLITDGAKVILSGEEAETVDRLFLNGVQQARGTYGTTASGAIFIDDTHFEGAGLLYVESNLPITSIDATWDGEGADAFISTAANWNGDTVPASNGTVHAIFASAGNTATIDMPMNLYGMTFNRDDSFTLTADNQVISNGFGGITAQAPATVSRTYTIAEDLLLSDKQSWSVTTNGSAFTTLSIDGHIDDGLIPCDITKTGKGTLQLTASNTFEGAFTANEGDLKLYHSQALGSTNGNTTIRGGNGTRLVLYGNLDIAEPLILNGEKDNRGTLIVGSGSHVISGPVHCINQVRLQGYNGPLTFTGGITADNNGLFVVNSGTFITFSENPLNLGTRTFYSDSGGVSVLAVAGNTWGDTLCAGGGIRCDAPNVFPATTSMRVGIHYSSNGKLDLNGNDQTIGKLYVDTNKQGNRLVTSATPAQLTVNQSANTVIDIRFSGAASLLKTGSGNLTLTNALNDTTGSFAVSNGTLTVGNQGTFGSNSTNIMVLGTGTLALQNSAVISDTATLSITDGGALINLATGVNETVSYLIINDVNMPVGTYGVTGSGADVIDDVHFAGTGILTITRNRDPGTIIILR